MMLTLLVLFWGGLKPAWEQGLMVEGQELRTGSVTLSPRLRDQISQGAVVGLLAGFRALVADFYWLDVHKAWERTEWSRVKAGVDLVTTLQPRAVGYWDMGAWHLAYNAAANKLDNPEEPSLPRRQRDALAWIREGVDLLKRGTAINPEKSTLWERLGTIYRDKLHDPAKAAECFRRASVCAHAPIYLERFYGYSLEDAGRKQEAYDYWKSLWNRPLTHASPQYAADKIRSRILRLEDELQVPLEKRVFPSGN
jgi:tetratricopeptide (TPR) repeat protein